MTTLRHTSLIITAACLGVGYLMASTWLLLPMLLVYGLYWFFTRKPAGGWPATVLLAVTVIFTTIGILAGVHVILMTIACVGALVNWDLTQFQQDRIGTISTVQSTSRETHHLQSLAWAALAGLALAILSAAIDLDFPLVIVILLVLISIVGVTNGLLLTEKRKKKDG
jgi:hypothetical protein